MRHLGPSDRWLQQYGKLDCHESMYERFEVEMVLGFRCKQSLRLLLVTARCSIETPVRSQMIDQDSSAGFRILKSSPQEKQTVLQTEESHAAAKTSAGTDCDALAKGDLPLCLDWLLTLSK